MTRDDLASALASVNLRAFLRVIRQGETTQDDDTAYRMQFGGGLFTNLADHPRQVVTVGSLSSSAAGAYQILEKTWDGLLKKYAFPDFSPASQDQAAVALIAGRGALQDAIDGRLDDAIAKCAKEWASLPGSPYGQPRMSLQTCHEVYASFGGVLAEQPPVIESIPAPTPEAKPMPLLAALIPLITQMLPQLLPILSGGHNSDEAKKWQGVGSIVADTLVKATNTDNVVQAVAAMQQNPQVLADASAAINSIMPQLLEVGGGIIEARKSAASTDQIAFYKNPAFIIAAFLTPLVYMVAVEILFNPSGQVWSDDIKMMFVTAIVSGLLGSITGFFLGSSLGSQKKDAVAASAAAVAAAK